MHPSPLPLTSLAWMCRPWKPASVLDRRSCTVTSVSSECRSSANVTVPMRVPSAERNVAWAQRSCAPAAPDELTAATVPSALAAARAPIRGRNLMAILSVSRDRSGPTTQTDERTGGAGDTPPDAGGRSADSRGEPADEGGHVGCEARWVLPPRGVSDARVHDQRPVGDALGEHGLHVAPHDRIAVAPDQERRRADLVQQAGVVVAQQPGEHLPPHARRHLEDLGDELLEERRLEEV